MTRKVSVVIVFLLTALPTLRAERIDRRNFAIDTYNPTPNEIRLAENRAKRFWERRASCFGPEPRYLAVETSKLFPADVVQDLWPKLINSETTASFFAHGRQQGAYGGLDPYGIMIYDTKAARFVGNQGYVSVDLPPRGTVARFGNYVARYIGTGG
ncbi:MAG: hypothetical protein JO069_16955 [Verrucomicrobia bacterium]|nr:hypothetical protein [Verrucomicrobiota bacterium]